MGDITIRKATPDDTRRLLEIYSYYVENTAITFEYDVPSVDEFSRSYRASIDRVQGITFTVPSREVQDKAIAKIDILEKQITEAQQKLDALSSKISDILYDYLQ